MYPPEDTNEWKRLFVNGSVECEDLGGLYGVGGSR